MIGIGKYKYETTMKACFVGYIVQAIINNFIPLLFVNFQKVYSISLDKITLFITVNFTVQIIIDFVATIYVDKIGYRPSIVAAHIFSAAGLISLTILPEIIDPFAGILTSICLYAIGGGLIEVLISPIMEACPTKNKEKAMSLLHSFYCWGHVGVVFLSTLFFYFFGIDNWKILTLIYSAIPIFNAFIFLKTPIASLLSDGEEGMTLGELFKNKIFWMLVVIMLCAGASELSVSQWSSLFAEKGLGLSKTMGDLAGPMFFAIMMGCSRVFYGKRGDTIDIDKFTTYSSILCIVSYLLISLVPSPIINLLACGTCGISVGIMWPGTFSKASATLKTGGTAMFALLALAGDLGCSAGPTLVGMISDAYGENIKLGILVAILFPIGFIFTWKLLSKTKKKTEGSKVSEGTEITETDVI